MSWMKFLFTFRSTQVSSLALLIIWIPAKIPITNTGIRSSGWRTIALNALNRINNKISLKLDHGQSIHGEISWSQGSLKVISVYSIKLTFQHCPRQCRWGKYLCNKILTHLDRQNAPSNKYPRKQQKKAKATAGHSIEPQWHGRAQNQTESEASWLSTERQGTSLSK